tara:strand:+ start:1288 stop:1581 length:294 start_codon:yes stop_codon:yes gene_type:complete
MDEEKKKERKRKLTAQQRKKKIKEDRIKLSKALQAGEKKVDETIVKIMELVPGSKGPPKKLLDFLEPYIKSLGKKSREKEKLAERQRKLAATKKEKK